MHPSRQRQPLAILAVLLSSALPAPGQVSLVADLSQTMAITREDAFGGPGISVVASGVAYFFQDDGIHGRELWRTDGTGAGTRMVRDLCSGRCGSAWIYSQLPLAAAGGLVFAAADDGVHGQELWVFDPTTDELRLVRDIFPGRRSSQPTDLAAVGANVFFTAEDSVHGRELWVSDGSPTGTHLVADLRPQDDPLWIGTYAELNGAFIFGSDGPLSEETLWRSDGTAAGTFQLAAVGTSSQSWTVGAPFRVLGNRLFFQGDPPPTGGATELWVSDGSPGGTGPFSPLADPTGFFVQGERMFFSAEADGQRGLYRIDELSTQPTQVTLPPGVDVSTNFGFFGEAAGLFLFAARDADHGQEFWASDGDTGWLVVDTRPGPDWGLTVEHGPHWFVQAPGFALAGDRAAFFANDGVHGRELWSTDGTTAGTALALDATPGADGTLSEGNSSLVAAPSLGSRTALRITSLDTGSRLLLYDGSSNQVEEVVSLDLQSSAFVPSSTGMCFLAHPPFEQCFSPLGSGLYFAVDDAESTRDLWSSDGTGAGSHRLLDLTQSGESVYSCSTIGGVGVFEAYTSTFPDTSIFSAGGAGEGVQPLSTSGGPGSNTNGFGVLGSHRYAVGVGGLWRSGGTPESTEELATRANYSPMELAVAPPGVFLSDQELWRFDPYESTMEALTNPEDELFPAPIRLTRLGDGIVFLAWAPDSGLELWRSDGTAPGTGLLNDIRPGPDSSIPPELWADGWAHVTAIVALGASAVFAADDGAHGEELWVTDGTSDGTQLLADLVPGPDASSPSDLTRVGQHVYFVAESAGSGRELWRTDGTSVGTTLVADLLAGPASSLPQELTAAGSELYFSVWMPGTGREPWRLRENPGPAPFLAPLADVAPGPLSSSPLAFLEVGGRVFFPANDNTLGFELWSVQEPDSIFSDGFESSGTAVWSVSAI